MCQSIQANRKVHTFGNTNIATIGLNLNAQEGLITQAVIDDLHQRIITRTRKDYGVDEISVNISVIPNQIFKFNFTEGKQS